VVGSEWTVGFVAGSMKISHVQRGVHAGTSGWRSDLVANIA